MFLFHSDTVEEKLQAAIREELAAESEAASCTRFRNKISRGAPQLGRGPRCCQTGPGGQGSLSPCIRKGFLPSNPHGLGKGLEKGRMSKITKALVHGERWSGLQPPGLQVGQVMEGAAEPQKPGWRCRGDRLPAPRRTRAAAANPSSSEGQRKGEGVPQTRACAGHPAALGPGQQQSHQSTTRRLWSSFWWLWSGASERQFAGNRWIRYSFTRITAL